MSKRSRFVLMTWVGNGVSVMKKAKMSTDKLLVKEIVQVKKKHLGLFFTICHGKKMS